MLGRNRLAGIQYVGRPGISQSCVQAIERMLQFNDPIVSAKVLTHNHSHCFILVVDEDEKVAVKSGFSSGYNGEGPRALARALKLLLDHGAEIDEVDVDHTLLERLDASGLTERDIETIESLGRVHPTRIYDYIYDAGGKLSPSEGCWERFPCVLPLAIIDRRLADLALRFYEAPADVLLQGFRRLEDTVRQRTELTEHGAKLFSQAFQGEEAKLTWRDVQSSEINGRVNLFTGAYMAHRNPRAHKELPEETATLVSEFILLNHLFLLEAAAIPRSKDLNSLSKLATPND